MKRKVGRLTFRIDDTLGEFTVFDCDGLFVGTITETQILRLAAKREQTSIRIESRLKDELWDLVNGNDRSISDVIRTLKTEHDKAGD